MTNSDRKKLFLDNRALALFILKQMKYPENIAEDVEQQAMMGLIRATQTYDSSKGKFSTYAAQQIKWSVKAFLYSEYSYYSFSSKNQIKEGKLDSVGNKKVDIADVHYSQCLSAGMNAESILEEIERNNNISHSISNAYKEVLNDLVASSRNKKEALRRYSEIYSIMSGESSKSIAELGAESNVTKQAMHKYMLKLKDALANRTMHLKASI